MTSTPLMIPRGADSLEVLPGSPRVDSPLFLDGWVTFNRLKWKVDVYTLRLVPDDTPQPALDALWYLDSKGHIWKPPLTPYLPVKVGPSAPLKCPLDEQRWLTIGGKLAADMYRRGVAMAIPLPPGISDVRPWQWAGFRADVRYTFYTALPYDPTQIDPAMLRYVSRARKGGFRCERTLALGAAVTCLQETEARQGFTFGLEAADLTLAQELVGEAGFRQYVGYAPDGTPATAAVVLHVAGGGALGLIFGTSTTYLSSGVAQLVVQTVLDDLTAAGAAGFDFVGANLPSIATAKSGWGARLQPYYTVDAGRARALARHARDYWQFQRGRTT